MDDITSVAAEYVVHCTDAQPVKGSKLSCLGTFLLGLLQLHFLSHLKVKHIGDKNC